MKHYETLIKLGCFTRQQLAEVTGSDAAATACIYGYLKKGYIERIRHNLYATISLESKIPILNRFQIGSHLFPDAYLSHHSAFEVYGCANQVFNEIYVSTKSRFKDFEYDMARYHRIAPKRNPAIIQEGGMIYTSPEQTVIDSICDFEKIGSGGLEETLRCMMLMPALDNDKLLDVLKQYNNGFLYQKTGYMLEEMNDDFDLPGSFFDECLKHIPHSKRYFTKEMNRLVFNKKWKLYVPMSLQKITAKGVDYDAF